MGFFGQAASYLSGITIGQSGGSAAPLRMPDTIGNTNPPFNIEVGGALSNAVFDSVWYCGWNITNGNAAITASAVRFGMALEYDYFSGGKHVCEWNLDWFSADSLQSVRALYLAIDRASTSVTSDVTWQFRIGNSGTSQFTVLDWAGTTTLFSVQKSTGNIISNGTRMQLNGSFPGITAGDGTSPLGFITANTFRVFVLASQDGLQFGNAGSDPKLYRSAASELTTDTALTVAGNFKVSTAGSGLYVKEGTNATMGVATLSGGTVVVATTKVTANSRIFLTGQNTSGTIGELTVSARTAGTSFTITGLGTDTRSVAWWIVEPA